jgi:hypothetical protein
MAENSNSGWGTGNTGSTGTTGSTGSTGTTGSTGGSDFGGSGGSNAGGSSFGGGSGSGTLGVTNASDTGTGAGSGTCASCGQSLNKSGSGLEQFLSRLGITEEMVSSLKGQFQNVEIDEYLNTARDYLKDGTGKASSYAKENPGKVAAGVAALALGAGLIYAATTRDKT